MRATIVMAQLNFLVGDIDGNARQIVESARQARSEFNADLVVFPELSLTGYPPEDLLLRPSLSKRIDRALAQIAEAGIECPIASDFRRPPTKDCSTP